MLRNLRLTQQILPANGGGKGVKNIPGEVVDTPTFERVVDVLDGWSGIGAMVQSTFTSDPDTKHRIEIQSVATPAEDGFVEHGLLQIDACQEDGERLLQLVLRRNVQGKTRINCPDL